MATLVPPARRLIFIEGARFRGAVSEELIQRIAATDNFISLYQFDEREFVVNGPYNITASAETFVDGIIGVPFAIEIFDVFVFHQAPGSGGTTELDIKVSTASGGPWTSIFSTTPKFTSAAVAGTFAFATGPAVTGVTLPVLTSTPLQVVAKSAFRLDFISKMTGTPSGTGVVIMFRPV